MADAGGDGTHQHLTAPGLVQVDGFDGQRFMHLAEDCGIGLHVRSSLNRGHYRLLAGTAQTAARTQQCVAIRNQASSALTAPEAAAITPPPHSSGSRKGP